MAQTPGKPDRKPRFPFVAALLCVACLGMAGGRTTPGPMGSYLPNPERVRPRWERHPPPSGWEAFAVARRPDDDKAHDLRRQGAKHAKDGDGITGGTATSDGHGHDQG